MRWIFSLITHIHVEHWTQKLGNAHLRYTIDKAAWRKGTPFPYGGPHCEESPFVSHMNVRGKGRGGLLVELLAAVATKQVCCWHWAGTGNPQSNHWLISRVTTENPQESLGRIGRSLFCQRIGKDASHAQATIFLVAGFF